MKRLLFIAVLFVSGLAGAQVSINGGASMLVGFNEPGPWGGFHVGLEIPRDDAVSIYGKFSHYFKKRGDISHEVLSIEQPTVPPTWINTNITRTPFMDYSILEGGTRYYLGNGFDYGFAVYGGTGIKLVFSNVKVRYDAPNENIADTHSELDQSGTIFSLGAGLGGGVKYSTIRFGTFYLDTDLSYMVFGTKSSNRVNSELYNPLIFTFGIGWRKDLIKR